MFKAVELVKASIAAFIVTGSVLVSGCKEPETAEIKQPVRAIKTLVLQDMAGDQVRRISGVVEAETVTTLSFETSGQITTLALNIGDFVDKDQVIGELDSEPYKLQLDQALAELDKARANFNDAQQKFDQQSALRKKGFATKTSLDTATATLEVSRSQLKVAETRVSIAQRDLRKTQLLAPFRGRVSAKYSSVYADVKAGEPIVEMHSEGQLKVEVSVPESLVRRLEPGAKVSVRFPTLTDLTSGGTIEDIGSRAGAANAFPVEIALQSQFPELRPGITAEVAFRFESENSGTGFVVPNTALLPGKNESEAFVFVFDKKKSAVTKKKVKVINLRNNELEIEGPLKAGDIIAAAGVSFLIDGMKTKIWKGK